MFNQATAFEHPLNERIRIFLRLEHLFEKIDYYLTKPDEWAVRTVVGTLLDILVISRVDIKNEILSELDRHIKTLEHLSEQTRVDPAALKRVLEDLKGAAENIRNLETTVAHSLRNNEFLKAILQRSSIPGGTCGFDLPHYGYWLRQPHAYRQRQLDIWIQDLLPIRDGIALLLSLIRGSCDPKEIIANEGLYQGTLDVQFPAQMVRVAIDPGLQVFPEISGHKHRFNIRFMEVKDTERPTQTDSDVTFMLTCCVF